jgi:hypothetical protein
MNAPWLKEKGDRHVWVSLNFDLLTTASDAEQCTEEPWTVRGNIRDRKLPRQAESSLRD